MRVIYEYDMETKDFIQKGEVSLDRLTPVAIGVDRSELDCL